MSKAAENPFGPSDRQTAKEILPTHGEINDKVLSENNQTVQQAARKTETRKTKISSAHVPDTEIQRAEKPKISLMTQNEHEIPNAIRLKPHGVEDLHQQPGSAKQGKEATTITVENKNASLAHVERVQESFNQISPNVRTFLAAHGIRVVAAGKMSDALGAEASEHPPDYNAPSQKNWDDTDGAATDQRRVVVVAEKYRSGWKFYDSDRVEGVTRHETGHALDHAMGDFSHSKEFQQAFEADISEMPAEVRHKLNYFIKSQHPEDPEDLGTVAGREEAFGEIFAMQNGGGAAAPKLVPLLLEYFQDTWDLVSAKIDQLNSGHNLQDGSNKIETNHQ